MKEIDSFCLSSYLAFRYVAKKGYEWSPGIGPEYPHIFDNNQISVGSAQEILTTLQKIISELLDPENTAIFLSGGIDSAILAALLPKGSRAYTINFSAETGVKEAEKAAIYADAYSLNHTVIDVGWDDYERYEPLLMARKKAPLHAVEVALYKASKQAINDGIKSVVLGNGADSTFGGLDKLLSKDWSFDGFMNRYTFVDPFAVLKKPVDISDIYAPYKKGDSIDYISFLKTVHGLGVIQAFNNCTDAAGINVVEPFEEMKLKGELDIDRIRAGEPKYLLIEVFNQLYPGISPPTKIPFARPMDEWLKDYKGPVSKEFKDNLDIESFSGDQKYLIHCLDRFINLLKADKI